MAKVFVPVAFLILASCCMTPRAARPQLKAQANTTTPPPPPPSKAHAEIPRVSASADLERPKETPAPQEPVLEKHILQPAELADIRLFSRFFGGGSARMKIRFVRNELKTRLKLVVWRKVPPDTITFALLVDRVEIRGRNAEGSIVYSKTLPGFTFGDSASGFWKETLSDLPRGVVSLSVAFFGNYE